MAEKHIAYLHEQQVLPNWIFGKTKDCALEEVNNAFRKTETEVPIQSVIDVLEEQ